MSILTQRLSTHAPGVPTACAIAVVTMAVSEGAAHSGWPVPMPSAWALLALLIASRFGGIAGGMWAAALLLAYSVHTSGFTTGHASEAVLWGQSSARILAFGLAAPMLVALAQTGWLIPAVAPQVLASGRWDEGSISRGRIDAGAARPPRPDVDKALAALCAVTRRSANELQDQLTVILGLCELRAAGAREAWSPEDSPDVIASAVERCYDITRTLRDVRGDCRPRLRTGDRPTVEG
jgi:hypothetical protein